MTISEKAAYLKGLTAGLGVDPSSRDGKLWTALNDLLGDIAHEIEDLQATTMDHADALDDMADELNYVEEMVCDLDEPDEDDDDYDDAYDDEDDEPEYDGIVYDATCPVCGEEISFDEDALNESSITCPGCGEKLEFDLGEEKE